MRLLSNLSVGKKWLERGVAGSALLVSEVVTEGPTEDMAGVATRLGNHEEEVGGVEEDVVYVDEVEENEENMVVIMMKAPLGKKETMLHKMGVVEVVRPVGHLGEEGHFVVEGAVEAEVALEALDMRQLRINVYLNDIFWELKKRRIPVWIDPCVIVGSVNQALMVNGTEHLTTTL